MEARFTTDLGMRAIDDSDVDKLTTEDETQQRYDRVARAALESNELAKHSFRLFCYYLFPGKELASNRRDALLTGQITMGDGRVIRRKDHIDMTEPEAA